MFYVTRSGNPVFCVMLQKEENARFIYINSCAEIEMKIFQPT